MKWCWSSFIFVANKRASVFFFSLSHSLLKIYCLICRELNGRSIMQEYVKLKKILSLFHPPPFPCIHSHIHKEWEPNARSLLVDILLQSAHSFNLFAVFSCVLENKICELQESERVSGRVWRDDGREKVLNCIKESHHEVTTALIRVRRG
jgi:hypothetical protein